MKSNINYKEEKNKAGNIMRLGYDANGNLVHYIGPNGYEARFHPSTGNILKIIRNNKIYNAFRIMNEDNGKYIQVRNNKDSSDIYTLFKSSHSSEIHWSEIKHEITGKTICYAEMYSNGVTKKIVDLSNKITQLLFPNGNIHIAIFPEKTVVYNYKGEISYIVKNNIIYKYKDGNIIFSMYKEGENKYYTYPSLCAGDDIKVTIFKSGLQYWYKKNKLIMKKYAKGTIIMYNKKGNKDKIIYKIMGDGTKIFYNNRENPSYEIKPNGIIYKYRGGRRIGK